ncbi:MAG: trimethylamine methyltransferase family protein, partial [Thermodesulfobacteriota bacterium]
EVGVVFHSRAAVDIFRQHGVRTDGNYVYIKPEELRKALDSSPSEFVLHARNPDKNITLGSGEVAFAPGYGAPHIMTPTGEKINATLEDYQKFCRLIHTSEVVNVSGFLIVDPEGRPRDTYHRDMLYSTMTLCDQPLMGSPLSMSAMQDAICMARILFGQAPDDDRPMQTVMISNINGLAPLQFSEEMSNAMIVSALNHQAVIIAGAGIMGATSPLVPAGHIAVQTASFLAGLVLTQLVQSGTPVVYGGGGSQLDMQSGSYYNGSPETLAAIHSTSAMAKFYSLPGRSGGGLNDAHGLDFQAGAQSAMALMSTLQAGIDFILHACGILASFMSMSYEKFIVDEELILGIQKMTVPIAVNDETIDMETIREVGPCGEYLTHRRTLELCRSAFMPTRVMNRLAFDSWQTQGAPDIYTRVGKVLEERFEAYRQPDLEPSIEKDLKNYCSK